MFGPTNPVGLEWIMPRIAEDDRLAALGLLAPAPEIGGACSDPKAYQQVTPLSEDEIRAPEEGEK